MLTTFEDFGGVTLTTTTGLCSMVAGLEVFAKRKRSSRFTLLPKRTTRSLMPILHRMYAPLFFFRHVPGSNSFDTVLIPTELVVDTCYTSFLKLEGDKLGEAESKVAWDRRLAMVASNSSEGEQEAFVISKYDLLPENLADMVQVTVDVIRGTFDSLFVHPYHSKCLALHLVISLPM